MESTKIPKQEPKKDESGKKNQEKRKSESFLVKNHPDNINKKIDENIYVHGNPNFYVV